MTQKNMKKPKAIIDVTDYGAKGNGVDDDHAAIQAALSEASRGSVVRIPAGEFAVSKTLRVSQSDIVFQGYGTLVPHGRMKDFLIEFRRGDRSTVDFVRDTIGLRLVVECLRINGLGRSSGVLFYDLYHCGIGNVNCQGVHGTAVRMHGVRESDFYQMNINHCSSPDERPLLDVAYHLGDHQPDPFGGGWQFSDGKTIDGQNNIRFFGLNLVHSMAATYVDIGGDSSINPHIFGDPARVVHFSGCQLHLTPRDWFKPPSYEGEVRGNVLNKDWNVHEVKSVEKQTMIRVRNARNVTFSQCNFPSSCEEGDVSLQLGDAMGAARDITLMGCRIHRNPLVADNVNKVTVVGCSFGPGLEEAGLERYITGKQADRVVVV